MQELSIGELEALVLKACRGAGYSWGLSQDAGRAASWLAVRGLPSADLFAAFLHQIDATDPIAIAPRGLSPKVNDDSPRCPIATGALISDYGLSVDESINVGSVYAPAILIPFVASCAKTAGIGLCMRCDRTETTFCSDGQLISSAEEIDAFTVATVSITRLDAPDELPVQAEHRRALVAETKLQILESLAHRTYVEASDQSRSGAGAGLTDND